MKKVQDDDLQLIDLNTGKPIERWISSGKRQKFPVLNKIIHKYFDGVFSWFRNLYIFKRANDAYLSIRRTRLIYRDRQLSGSKDRFIYEFDSESKKVTGRIHIDVNDDGTPKVTWVTLKFKARESSDDSKR